MSKGGTKCDAACAIVRLTVRFGGDDDFVPHGQGGTNLAKDHDGCSRQTSSSRVSTLLEAIHRARQLVLVDLLVSGTAQKHVYKLSERLPCARRVLASCLQVDGWNLLGSSHCQASDGDSSFSHREAEPSGKIPRNEWNGRMNYILQGTKERRPTSPR
jgi:hypothetical protein